MTDVVMGSVVSLVPRHIVARRIGRYRVGSFRAIEE